MTQEKTKIIDPTTGVEKQDWMDDATFQMAILEETARRRTQDRKNSPVENPKAIVAIKSQHPLVDGKPGPEFEARLQKALNVAHGLTKRGITPVFFVYGGEHAGDAEVTLADAGEAWLLKHGVDAASTKQIIVFAGNDEDTFTADEFENDPQYIELHVACCAGQMPRCWLNYSMKGWQPTLHPVTYTEAKPHQSMVCELKGGWAVPAYFKANAAEAVQAATEGIRQRHHQELADQKNQEK